MFQVSCLRVLCLSLLKPLLRIKGTRLTVEIIVEKVAYGESIENIMKDYPFLMEDDMKAAFLYAAKCVGFQDVYAI